MPEESSKKFDSKKIYVLAEGAVMLALAIVLSRFKLYQMPAGGSINLFGYLPLFVFAVRHGVGKGMLVGAIFGFLDFIINPYFVNVVQVLLDYILAYGSLGLAGFACTLNRKFPVFNNQRVNIANVLCCLIAGCVRILFAIFSGVFFYMAGKSWSAAFIASAAYNIPYGIVNTLLAILGIILLQPALTRLKK